MSKPITPAVEISTLPFDDRVQLVHEEIQRRKQETLPENPGHFVARLWISWLNKNFLDVPAGQEVQSC